MFSLLHVFGITPDLIIKRLSTMKLVPGIRELLYGLPREYTEFIILSDGFSIAIDILLEKEGLKEVI